MGKQRKRNRNRRKHTWRQFHANSSKQAFENEVEREAFDREQEEHLQRIVEQKKDILMRTVLVGSVLGSLHSLEKREGLKRFMQQYGPVQQISVRKGKHPMGLVTFNFQTDAEKIFGGTSLINASKANKQVRIGTPVGYKGIITVRPASNLNGLTGDDLNSTSSIQVNTRGLLLGHWFPAGKDESLNVPGLEHLAHSTSNTWLQVSHNSNVNPIIKIDIQKAVVELDISHCVQSNDSIFSGQTESFISLLIESVLNQKLNQERRTSVSFRFKDLTHSIKFCCNQRKYFLLFELRHPPRLTVTTVDDRCFETVYRLTALDKLPEIGSSMGYCLEVDKVEIERLINSRAFGKLKKMGLCDDEFESIELAENVSMEKVCNTELCLNEYVSRFPSHRISLLVHSVVDANSCILSDMLQDKVTGKDILSLIKDSELLRAERVLNGMREMHGKTRYPAHMFHALYEDETETEVNLVVPEFCISLPRILITPLRAIVTGFEVEMSNRMVRKFIEKHGFSEDSFIRASIGDENTDNLYSNDLTEQVERRMKELVLKGITFGKKNYSFLAYSSSQLKEQSLWLVCPHNGWNVEKMRASMGDFSMCKTPSKYAARIGQCFSTTISVPFCQSQVDERSLINWTKSKLGYSPGSELRVDDSYPEIVSSTGMEHSDGVGLISKRILSQILLQISFVAYKDLENISAIQIRYGGAKGVLVAWDFAKLNIGRFDVCLRPSMIKFKAPYENLEIVNVARRIPYYLNRNVILLGEHHNIPVCTFLQLQDIHIDSLNIMLRDSAFALSFLSQLNGPDNALMNSLQDMLTAGIEVQKDPFLYSCLHCIRSHHLMNLRKKARVHVKKGAVLIGGIDELGLVPENCCYLQVPIRDGGQNKEEYTVVTGRVMVTKHPVMHPGDMRMLTAVDVPELKGLKNVILFSQRGERPEADKMSGSDLDGDQFAITWDRRLFLANTATPMDYSPIKKPDKISTISDDSLLEHFINHARNSNLGKISMLWIDHATIERNAGCVACLKLAKLASTSVDFPKSGIPAVIDQDLLLKPNIPRAHWRELTGKPSFKCESAVGQLYDQVIYEMKSKSNMPQYDCIAMAGRNRDNNGQILYFGEQHRLLQGKQLIFSEKNSSLTRRLGLKVNDLDAMVLDYADHQRFLYESQLLELMNQYRIKSEGEIVTGCILKWHKLHKRRRHDIAEEVRRQFRAIRKLFRSEFFTAVYHLVHDHVSFFVDDNDLLEDDVSQKELEWVETVSTGVSFTAEGERPFGETSEKVMQMACRLAHAYYVVTYSPLYHADDSRSVLYSFPWVVASDVIAYNVNINSSANAQGR